ncbi:hypothetical protein [Edaphobacillus lindanitolerans]|uniref:Uncharacterized protein n=1 Tax=Edaphobacillus lindanitolerans TaxID=550447 RepID=A0A1U7PIF0_9BACI|nr:hypothetical protein [Edaphobacillus lindanitolerans]SIT73420.1 hypothetical protein SAMN05428946_0981 [Edaphobacillus lindanitolerans]
MKITEARYLDNGEIHKIALEQMTVRKYENYYKGKLYCPTPACTARVAFCAGRTPYYKTWNLDNHSDNCLHKFDRIPKQIGTYSGEVFIVNISRKRRSDALNEAFRLSQMTDEEIEEAKARRKASRRNKQQETMSNKKIIKPSIQTSLFDGEEEGKLKIRGKNIMKRDVDRITQNDIGKIRLVTGFVEKIELLDNVATFKVMKNGVTIKVLFEEAFVAEPENKAYLNNFHVPKIYIKKRGVAIFNGIGEIRTRDDHLILTVYHGNDFYFDGHNMLRLGFV